MINTYILEKEIERLEWWPSVIRFNGPKLPCTPLFNPEERKAMEEKRQELLNQLYDIKDVV